MQRTSVIASGTWSPSNRTRVNNRSAEVCTKDCNVHIHNHVLTFVPCITLLYVQGDSLARGPKLLSISLQVYLDVKGDHFQQRL
jgi:hypothetical protein